MERKIRYIHTLRADLREAIEVFPELIGLLEDVMESLDYATRADPHLKFDINPVKGQVTSSKKYLEQAKKSFESALKELNEKTAIG